MIILVSFYFQEVHITYTYVLSKHVLILRNTVICNLANSKWWKNHQQFGWVSWGIPNEANIASDSIHVEVLLQCCSHTWTYSLTEMPYIACIHVLFHIVLLLSNFINKHMAFCTSFHYINSNIACNCFDNV